KGMGGALLREKIIAQNAKTFVVIADASKSVPFLGAKTPLPVEVVPFGFESHAAFFREMDCQPVLRKAKDGSIFVTDNGNYIYDCRFKKISNAMVTAAMLHSRAGVVETGLFVGIVSIALVADENAVQRIERPAEAVYR